MIEFYSARCGERYTSPDRQNRRRDTSSLNAQGSIQMRLLILGTGGMANQHARNFSAIKGVSVVGGVDVVPERLAAFCAEHKIDRQFRQHRGGARLGRVRRGGERHAGPGPSSDHHARDRRRQACVLREAARDRRDQGDGDDRGDREGRPRRHGQLHLSQLAGAAEGPADGARRPDRRGAARRGVASAELARRQGVGRLEERKQMALAALEEARIERRARRHRHPYRRFRVLRLGPRCRARLRRG